MNWLAVALGGALGACMRYGLMRALPPLGGYPWAIQLANVAGSFLIGVLFVQVAMRWGNEHVAWQLLGVGLLGGFTTYSTFSMDTVRLLEQGRWNLALVYVLSTLALCIGMAAMGVLLGRRLM
ncbi:camphor resistance protein CrcB [Oceanococcus atlanticus]|uniref:Fluoride-specific ion channel FluC n=1 Tax=Oceanococcus atlanticus TaxID=1317117 RepID=A0A1Y1SFH7_9GAMM|nr:CrcB family protein [Oceanococcus atlanticus]ORE88422.1 camphor resistance protein CrcB [Oceanococcus atlanticus]